MTGTVIVAPSRPTTSPFQIVGLKVAIAACHARARTADETDWARASPHSTMRSPSRKGYGNGRAGARLASAGIGLREKAVPFDLLWFSTPIPTGLSNRVYAKVTRNELFVSFARCNKMQVGWLIHKGEYAQIRTRPFIEVTDHIAKHVPVQPEAAVRGAVKGWSDLSLLPTVSQIAERWSKPGLLLLGDAAHPMSPAGGQGINVAIYDAVVAARRLVPALNAGLPLDDVACSIESERRPAVVSTQKAQNMLTDVLCALGPGRALRLAIAVVSATARWPIRPRFLTRAVEGCRPCLQRGRRVTDRLDR